MCAFNPNLQELCRAHTPCTASQLHAARQLLICFVYMFVLPVYLLYIFQFCISLRNIIIINISVLCCPDRAYPVLRSDGSPLDIYITLVHTYMYCKLFTCDSCTNTQEETDRRLALPKIRKSQIPAQCRQFPVAMKIKF